MSNGCNGHLTHEDVGRHLHI